MKEGQVGAEQLVRYDNVCAFLCVRVCVFRMGRLLGETYRQEGEVKFTASSSRSVHTPHAITHSHTYTQTHTHSQGTYTTCPNYPSKYFIL